MFQFYHGGTADGIELQDDDAENEALLRDVKVKMGGAKIVISYPSKNLMF